jgi:hypothetical protein
MSSTEEMKSPMFLDSLYRVGPVIGGGGDPNLLVAEGGGK